MAPGSGRSSAGASDVVQPRSSDGRLRWLRVAETCRLPTEAILTSCAASFPWYDTFARKL